MIAHHGYKDGSGEYYISIDTDKCDGCADCVPVCPASILEVVDEDPYDPFREIPVLIIKEDERNKIKYSCAPCKPDHDRPELPCIAACSPDAIAHSW